MEDADGFDSFSVEMGDFEIRKVKKFDRMWKAEPGGSIYQMLLLHEGVLYFGSCNFNIYAINASDGSLLWKFKTEGIVGGSPLYYEGKIYAGSFDHNMYCIDASTGKMLWKFRADEEIAVTPFAWKGRIFFGSKDHFMYCLDSDTGKMNWKFRTQDTIVSAAFVYGNKLLFGSFDHNFYCIDANSGELIWKFGTQGEIVMDNIPLVHEGKVYFSSFDNNVRAVDLESGEMVWKFNTGSYGNSVAPVLHDSILYHTSRDGRLFALTPGGRLLWKFTNKENLSLPFIHGDKIFVGGEDYNLHCISLDGKKLWSYKTEGPVFQRAAADESMVFFPSWDCNVYALGIETRKLAWKFRCEGSPSRLPPVYDSFEVVMKIPETTFNEEPRRLYDTVTGIDTEENTSSYKSEITYRMGTAYINKTKYQVDEKTEGF